MKQSLRSLAKRLASPWLGALDRRFAESNELQRTELERLDERVAIELRVVDEHLLAIRRLVHRVDPATSTVHEAFAAQLVDALASDRPGLIVVATPSQPLVVPDGCAVDVELAFRAADDGPWTQVPVSDDPSTLRVTRLHSRR